jgi:hypothetical protein
MAEPDGLLYHPSRYDPPLGLAGFEARLTDRPAARYFDARRALFPVEAMGVLKLQAMEHPWNGGPELRFAGGRIRLEAHDGDHVEVYGFGGVTTVTVEGEKTICRVASTAPFLPLSDDPESPFTLLESELEVILAQSRARWGQSESLHLDRLGHVEPMTLFVASLAALEARLARLARPEGDETIRRGLRLVRGWREQLARAGEWPAAPPDLDSIL